MFPPSMWLPGRSSQDRPDNPNTHYLRPILPPNAIIHDSWPPRTLPKAQDKVPTEVDKPELEPTITGGAEHASDSSHLGLATTQLLFALNGSDANPMANPDNRHPMMAASIDMQSFLRNEANLAGAIVPGPFSGPAIPGARLSSPSIKSESDTYSPTITGHSSWPYSPSPMPRQLWVVPEIDIQGIGYCPPAAPGGPYPYIAGQDYHLDSPDVKEEELPDTPEVDTAGFGHCGPAVPGAADPTEVIEDTTPAVDTAGFGHCDPAVPGAAGPMLVIKTEIPPAVDTAGFGHCGPAVPGAAAPMPVIKTEIPPAVDTAGLGHCGPAVPGAAGPMPVIKTEIPPAVDTAGFGPCGPAVPGAAGPDKSIEADPGLQYQLGAIPGLKMATARVPQEEIQPAAVQAAAVQAAAGGHTSRTPESPVEYVVPYQPVNREVQREVQRDIHGWLTTTFKEGARGTQPDAGKNSVDQLGNDQLPPSEGVSASVTPTPAPGDNTATQIGDSLNDSPPIVDEHVNIVIGPEDLEEAIEVNKNTGNIDPAGLGELNNTTHPAGDAERVPVAIEDDGADADVHTSTATATAPVTRPSSSSNSGISHIPPPLDCGIGFGRCGSAGIGVLAHSDFDPGQVIYAEAPFMTVAHPVTEADIFSRMASLNASEKNMFYSYFTSPIPNNIHREVGIFTGASLSFVEGVAATSGVAPPEIVCHQFARRHNAQESRLSGMFNVASRLNHSCAPNCLLRWDDDSKKIVIVALDYIEVDDELTYSYVGSDHILLLDPQACRRAELYRLFGFKCRCPDCTDMGPSVSERDKELSWVRAQFTKWAHHEDRLVPTGPVSILKNNFDVEEILCKQTLTGFLHKLYEHDFDVHARNGNAALASEVAETLHEDQKSRMGEAAAASMPAVEWMQNPRGYEFFGSAAPEIMSLPSDSSPSSSEKRSHSEISSDESPSSSSPSSQSQSSHDSHVAKKPKQTSLYPVPTDVPGKFRRPTAEEVNALAARTPPSRTPTSHMRTRICRTVKARSTQTGPQFAKKVRFSDSNDEYDESDSDSEDSAMADTE